MVAKFEWLPNEILLDLFGYLNNVHLFCAFYRLNSRLNTLLSIHFRVYHFDFRSISKEQFHIICEEHLPRAIDRIKSLCLSDDDETPNLPELFFGYNLSLEKFCSLKSLLLDSIHCLSRLNQITYRCRQIPSLTHLSILKCNFQDQDNLDYLIENIWSLPKLIFCEITHQVPYQLKFRNNEVISSTIENLFLDNFQFNFDNFSHLLRCTRSLRQFHGSIREEEQSHQLHIQSSSINSLKISFRKPFDSIYNFFKNFSHLSCLIVKTDRLYINGNDWMKTIRNYLPKLEIFHLKMDLKFSHPKHIEEQLDGLVDSFRTRFWIEERQWFVQCHWFSIGITNFATLYTLPYAFDEFLLTNQQWSKSTHPNDNHCQSYDRVNTLRMMNIGNNYSKIYDFQNLLHLKINLPLNKNFWSSLHSLDQLVTLNIAFVHGCDHLPLQTLLDRSPRLQSLCFANFSDLNIVSKLTSKLIDQLDFLTKNTYKKYFNSTQCSILTSSALGHQCKVLLICVESRFNVIELVKNMTHLRSLILQCKDDQLNDKYIHWLRCHLPSTSYIRRDTKKTSNIRLWIR